MPNTERPAAPATTTEQRNYTPASPQSNYRPETNQGGQQPATPPAND